MRKSSSGRSNENGARAMDQCDDKIAQGSQDLRGRPSAKTGPILSKGDIADVMRAVLNVIIPSYQFWESLALSNNFQALGSGKYGIDKTQDCV